MESIHFAILCELQGFRTHIFPASAGGARHGLIRIIPTGKTRPFAAMPTTWNRRSSRMCAVAGTRVADAHDGHVCRGVVVAVPSLTHFGLSESRGVDGYTYPARHEVAAASVHAGCAYRRREPLLPRRKFVFVNEPGFASRENDSVHFIAELFPNNLYYIVVGFESCVFVR